MGHGGQRPPLLEGISSIHWLTMAALRVGWDVTSLHNKANPCRVRKGLIIHGYSCNSWFELLFLDLLQLSEMRQAGRRREKIQFRH